MPPDTLILLLGPRFGALLSTECAELRRRLRATPREEWEKVAREFVESKGR